MGIQDNTETKGKRTEDLILHKSWYLRRYGRAQILRCNWHIHIGYNNLETIQKEQMSIVFNSNNLRLM